eukprot:5282207-Prymnesium_polylepis.1
MGAADACVCACAMLVSLCAVLGVLPWGGALRAARALLQAGTSLPPHALRRAPLTPHRTECCASPRPPHALAMALAQPSPAARCLFTPHLLLTFTPPR